MLVRLVLFTLQNKQYKITRKRRSSKGRLFLYLLICIVCSKVKKAVRNISNRFLRAGNGTQTRDPQLGRLMLYQLSYSRICNKRSGRRWIRTTEVVRQQIYSLPHLATLVFALFQLRSKGSQIILTCKQKHAFLLLLLQLHLLYSRICLPNDLWPAACFR